MQGLLFIIYNLFTFNFFVNFFAIICKLVFFHIDFPFFC